MSHFRLLAACAALSSLAAAAEYQVDSAHTAASFAVRHMMVSTVRGQFKGVTGTVVWDPERLDTASINVAIDANTVNTGEPKRDAHLKSPDFFDTAKYPALAFKSRRVTRSGDTISVTGDLTMHGVAREVVLTVDGPTPVTKDPFGNLRFGASATGKVNRKDWGLVWNKALDGGGLLIGDDVSITIDIEAFRKP